MAHGALLETLRIAASSFGLSSEWTLRPGSPDNAPVYDVRLRPEPGLASDPLLPFVEKRTVQRRPMRTTPLSEAQHRSLSSAVGSGFTLQYFECLRERLAIGRMLADNGRIWLTCPEAYEVHRSIIEWGARFSADRIPDQSLGVNALTARIVEWELKSWSRVDFVNRYLLGTLVLRVQLDFLPALLCGAHLLLRPVRPPATLLDYVDAGVAMQRLWLTATACGLQLQPQMTPVIFR